VSDSWERLTPLLIIVVAGILWATLGALTALVFCSIALLSLVVHHWRHLIMLERWLQAEELASVALPDSSGKWGDVFARLARIMREQRKNHQQLGSALERLRRATSAMVSGGERKSSVESTRTSSCASARRG